MNDDFDENAEAKLPESAPPVPQAAPAVETCFCGTQMQLYAKIKTWRCPNCGRVRAVAGPTTLTG